MNAACGSAAKPLPGMEAGREHSGGARTETRRTAPYTMERIRRPPRPHTPMSPLLNIAVDAAEAAGRVIIRHHNFTDRIAVERKEAHDLVCAADREAEREIVERIARAHPQHSIRTEEASVAPRAGAEYEWLVDPLDGTTNFLLGVPHYAVSIALRSADGLRLAVVYDPIKQELFTAEAGRGAFLNRRRIRARDRDRLGDALLATGIPFRGDADLDRYLPTLQALAPGTLGVRRLGAAALDLAYVAAGRFQGFWEFGLRPWDVAAGMLLAREAGAVVRGLGAGDPLDTGDIIAAPPKTLTAMLGRLEPVLAAEAAA